MGPGRSVTTLIGAHFVVKSQRGTEQSWGCVPRLASADHVIGELSDGASALRDAAGSNLGIKTWDCGGGMAPILCHCILYECRIHAPRPGNYNWVLCLFIIARAKEGGIEARDVTTGNQLAGVLQGV